MKAGIQAIIIKINEDAEQHSGDRYAQIKKEVDAEIGEENALGRDEFQKRREILVKQNEHEYMNLFERIRSRLNRELLTYQDELADEIFGLAVSKLRAAPDDAFFGMFKAAVMGLEGNFKLYLGEFSKGKLDARKIGEAVGGGAGLRIALSPEAIPKKSGFLLEDGRVEYNCLFEDLIEDKKNAQSAAIMKELFGETKNWMFA
jgi:vacuolar-type H+-ATPase subunit E/Vma4